MYHYLRSESKKNKDGKKKYIESKKEKRKSGGAGVGRRRRRGKYKRYETEEVANLAKKVEGKDFLRNWDG